MSRNLDLADLRTQLLEDKNYTTRIIPYFDTIISCYVDKVILQTLILLSDQYISLFVRGWESNFDWLELINYDSNAVAAVK